MLTSAKIVEQIQRILSDPDGVEIERYQELSQQYGAACDALNERLSEALSFYTSGFYCEAVRFVKEEKLLEEFNTLLFPDLTLWRQACLSFDCEIKSNVSIANGTTLQEFMASYEINRELFERNRYLAFANASAVERLETLRQLIALYPNNPTFARSIEALEKRRNFEIDDYLASVTKSNASLEATRRILNELESSERRLPPPPKTLERLRNIERYLIDEERKSELRALTIEWLAAVDAKAENDALERLEEYRKFCDDVDARLDLYYSELSEGEQKALRTAIEYSETVEKRNSLETTLRRREFELKNALEAEEDEAVVVAALSNLEHAASAAGRANAPETAQNARVYIEDLRLKKRRSTTLKIVGVTAFVAALALATGYSTYFNVSKKKAVSAADAICEALDEYDKGDVSGLKRAEKRIDKLRTNEPKLENFESVESAIERYETTLSVETSRLQEIDDLRARIAEKHATGMSDASLLSSLKQVGRTDSEKKEYNALFREDVQLRSQRDDEAEAKFSAELERLKADFDALKQEADELSTAETALKIARLKRGLNDLRETTSVSKIAGSLETARAALAGAVAAFERNNAQVGSSESLVKAVGNPAKFKSAFERAGANLGLDDNAFADAILKIDLIDSSSVWNDFVQKRCSDRASWRNDREKLADVLGYIELNKAQLSFAPEFAAVQAYASSLQENESSLTPAALVAGLRDSFAEYSERYWTLYHEETGRYYYLLKEIEYGDAGMIDYRPSRSGDLRKFNADFMAEEDVATEAIQYRIYSILNSSASEPGFSRSQWLETIQNSASLVVDADETELDPAVQAILLYKILKAASQDPAFSELQRYVGAFESAEGFKSDVDFYKQDAGLEQVRGAAKTILRSLDVDELKDKLSALTAQADSVEPNFPSYKWIGFLDEGSDGLKIEVGESVKKNELEGATLWIARPEGGAANLVECGKVLDGKAQADDAKLTHGDRWSPVYARVEQRTK